MKYKTSYIATGKKVSVSHSVSKPGVMQLHVLLQIVLTQRPLRIQLFNMLDLKPSTIGNLH
jgi:hypothetical protein